MDDYDDELVSPVRNHGKIDPIRLNPATRLAIMQLKQHLNQEPGLVHAQITFDEIANLDAPPTLHVVVDADPQANWPNYWFGEK